MNKKCLQCKKEFSKKKTCSKKEWEFVKFCSKNCYTKSMKGKDILKENRNTVAWNKGKQFLKNRGDNHPNWKGGLTRNERHTEMGRIEYKLWRKSVFERDNYTCQKTSISGGNLEAHHIFNYKDFPELKFAIDNGITLSKNSHKLFHKIYGNRNNTKEQLVEFLAQEA